MILIDDADGHPNDTRRQVELLLWLWNPHEILVQPPLKRTKYNEAPVAIVEAPVVIVEAPMAISAEEEELTAMLDVADDIISK